MTLNSNAATEVHSWLGGVQGGNVLTDLVDVLVAPLAEVEDVTRASSGRPGWARLLDPDTCPAALLPYLAQWVGVRLDQRTSIAAQRQQLKERPYHLRGTPAAIISAASLWLSSGEVTLTERDGGAYQFTVNYTTAQVGGLADYDALAAGNPTYDDVAVSFKTYDDFNGDEAAMQAAVLDAKPVGLVVTFNKT